MASLRALRRLCIDTTPIAHQTLRPYRIDLIEMGAVAGVRVFGQPLLLGARISSSAVARRSRLSEIAVSDQATLEGLTQFLTQSPGACLQIAEGKSIRGPQDLKERFAL